MKLSRKLFLKQSVFPIIEIMVFTYLGIMNLFFPDIINVISIRLIGVFFLCISVKTLLDTIYKRKVNKYSIDYVEGIEGGKK